MEEKKIHHMIELDGISFSYPGESMKALDDISVSFDAGRCYCLIGPNGCGKSTLFRILLALDYPAEGHYFFDGSEITAKKMKDEAFAAAFHRKIGFLFQNSEIQLFTRSVEDEIAFGLRQMGLKEEEVQKRVDQYIALFQLDDVRHRAPFNISGGEKKRTALAAVCAMEPEVLVMDEPLAGLDEDGQQWMMEWIRKSLDKDRLFIIATHSRTFARNMADEIIVMNKYHQIERNSEL